MLSGGGGGGGSTCWCLNHILSAAADRAGAGTVAVHCASPTKMSKTSLPEPSKGHGDSEKYAY